MIFEDLFALLDQRDYQRVAEYLQDLVHEDCSISELKSALIATNAFKEELTISDSRELVQDLYEKKKKDRS